MFRRIAARQASVRPPLTRCLPCHAEASGGCSSRVLPSDRVEGETAAPRECALPHEARGSLRRSWMGRPGSGSTGRANLRNARMRLGRASRKASGAEGWGRAGKRSLMPERPSMAAKLRGGRMGFGPGAPGRSARRNFHFAMLVPVMQSVGIMHPGWKILKNGRFRAHFQHVRRRH